MTCAGLGRLADEITVTTEDDGIAIELGMKSSLAGDVEPALVDVADGSTNDVVVRDERDVSYRRISETADAHADSHVRFFSDPAEFHALRGVFDAWHGCALRDGEWR